MKNVVKDKRKYLWIYAVVLFSSAFVVLVMTAFSQIKQSSNIENYDKELKEYKNKYTLSLDTADKDKKTLQDKITQLQSENNNLKIITENNNSQILIQKIESCKNSYENLLQSDKLYSQEKYIEAAKGLRNVKEEELGEQAKKKYMFLKSKVYIYATKDYYKRAKHELSRDSYSKAMEYFEESLIFDETKYYEENTLYYLAYISSKLKQAQKLNRYSNDLIKRYPSSEYAEKVKNLK